jgi:DUF4097 and DUF4098 domain-containing protein YvlB
MSYVEENAVLGTVRIEVPVVEADVMVKGSDNARPIRVIGESATTSTASDGSTLVEVEDSVQIEVPYGTPVFINGTGVNNVMVRELGAVEIETVHNSISAHDLASLTVSTIHNDAAIKGLQGDLTLGNVEGNLSVKEAKNIVIDTVEGNTDLKSFDHLTFHALQGDTHIKYGRTVNGSQVGGNASFKELENVTLNTVQGNLKAKHVTEMRVDSVEGNAELKDVRGMLVLDNVDGNLEVKGFGTGVVAENVQGNVLLIGTWQQDGDYRITSQGNVSLITDGAAHLIITSEGRTRLGQGYDVTTDADGTTHVYLGKREGAATVTIECEGNVSLNPRETEHREPEHRSHNHRYQREWEHHWEGGHRPHDHRAPDVDVEEEIRRTMNEVRSEVERASDNVRREFQRAARDIDTAGRGPIGSVIRSAMKDLMNSLRDKPVSVKVEEPVQETPVVDTSEETKMILQMIAEGKITPEQGEQLLQAMGDK